MNVDGVGMTMTRIAASVMAVALAWPPIVQAEDTRAVAKINSIKVEILEAENIQKKFAGAMKHCGALDGKHFYIETQDRVLDLDQFHKSLESMVKEQVFNPQKKRPWTQADAQERLDLVQKMAEHDKYRCDMVAKLPTLQKELVVFERQQ
jgi:hypothetical protein